jgi:hypothetical protein
VAVGPYREFLFIDVHGRKVSVVLHRGLTYLTAAKQSRNFDVKTTVRRPYFVQTGYRHVIPFGKFVLTTPVTQLRAALADLDWICPKGWIFETNSCSFTPRTSGVPFLNPDALFTLPLIVSTAFSKVSVFSSFFSLTSDTTRATDWHCIRKAPKYSFLMYGMLTELLRVQ